MTTIACPKCRRQYQVNGDPTGKNVKCASCQHVFTVGARAPAAAPQQAAQVAAQVGDKLTSQPGLFPDVIPAGPDPLANHVVQDPGFAEVDIAEIRRNRETEERKTSRYKADDPLAKFNRENREKKEEDKLQAENTKKGLRAGLIGAGIYLLIMIVAVILAHNYEWGFYVLLATGLIGTLFVFLTDIMLIQHVKQHDPEQYAYYTFLIPYRIYYWYVNWKDLMGFVVIEIAVGIPTIINGLLIWYYDDKWGMGWFEF